MVNYSEPYPDCSRLLHSNLSFHNNNCQNEGKEKQAYFTHVKFFDDDSGAVFRQCFPELNMMLNPLAPFGAGGFLCRFLLCLGTFGLCRFGFFDFLVKKSD